MPIGGFKAGFREWFWSRCWAVGFVFVASKTSGWFLQWFIAGTPLGHLIIYNSVYKHNTYKKYVHYIAVLPDNVQQEGGRGRGGVRRP